MRKLLYIILSLVLILSFTACQSNDNNNDDGGQTTVSQGRIFTDTDNSEHICSITSEDSTQSGTDIEISEADSSLSFSCQGLNPDSTLWVFIDGDIDDIGGEFDNITSEFSSTIELKSSFKRAKEHTIQFVQFSKSDGWEPEFCKTCHYTIKGDN